MKSHRQIIIFIHEKCYIEDERVLLLKSSENLKPIREGIVADICDSTNHYV